MAKLTELKQEVTDESYRAWRANYKPGDPHPPEMEKYALDTATKMLDDYDAEMEADRIKYKALGIDI